MFLRICHFSRTTTVISLLFWFMKASLDSRVEVFMRKYGFRSGLEPQGITSDELYRSMEYLFATPSPFAYEVRQSGRGFDRMYEDLLEFVNSKTPELTDILFPVFCHAIMSSVKHDDAAARDAFFEKFVTTLPPKYQDEAVSFFRDAEEFHKLAPLFATQKFVVKCTKQAAARLNGFLNENGNSELRRFVTENVMLEPCDPYVPLNYVQYKLEARAKLSVVRARVCGLAHICCGNHPGNLYGSLSDRAVGVIDVHAGTTRELYRHLSDITTVSASSQGNVLFSGDYDGKGVLWSESAMQRFTVCGNGALWCSAFAPRGGVVAVGSQDASILMLEAATTKPFRMFTGHAKAVTGVAFHPNCSIIGSVSTEACVRLWDVREAVAVRLFHSDLDVSKLPCFSPNGQMFAFVDNSLRIGDIGTGTIVKQVKLDRPSGVVYCGFSQDGKRVFLAFRDGTLTQLDLEKDQFDLIAEFGTPIVYGHMVPYTDEIFVATEHVFIPNLPCYCL